MKKHLVAAGAAFAIVLAGGSGGGTAFAADLDRGAELFELCSPCHAANGGGNQLYLAPAIAGQLEWYLVAQLTKFKSGLRGLHFDDLAGMRMRPMSLTLGSKEDVAAVAAYVASLPPTGPAPVLTGGDAARGKTFFTAICATCHGVNAEGNKQLNAPKLVGGSDWYLFEQVLKFRAGIRGGDPRDVTGIQMRPMSLTLPDEQAVRDVIAHISSLAR